MLIPLFSTAVNANLVTELLSKTFLIRCRTMDGLKVNAGVKLAGSLTTTSRNGNVCLQVKLAKFSETLTEPYIPPCLYTVLCPLSSEKICNFAENSLLDGFLPGRQHCLNPYGRNWTLMLIFILQLSRQYITIPFLFWTCNKISNQASTVLYHFTCLFKSYLWHAIWYSRAHLLLVQEVRSVI